MQTLQVSFKNLSAETEDGSTQSISISVSPYAELNETDSPVVGTPFYLQSIASGTELPIHAEAICGIIAKYRSGIPITDKKEITFLGETEKTVEDGAKITSVSFLCGRGNLVKDGNMLRSTSPVYGIVEVEYQYYATVFKTEARSEGKKLFVFSVASDPVQRTPHILDFTEPVGEGEGTEDAITSEEDLDDLDPCDFVVYGGTSFPPPFYRGEWVTLHLYGKDGILPGMVSTENGESYPSVSYEFVRIEEPTECSSGEITTSYAITSDAVFIPSAGLPKRTVAYTDGTTKGFVEDYKQYRQISGTIRYKTLRKDYKVFIPINWQDEKFSVLWQLTACYSTYSVGLEVDPSVSSAYGEAFGTVVSASDPTVVLSGVKVTSDDFGTRITDADGFFSFGTKRAGTYTVSFEDPNDIYLDLEDADLIVVAGVTS